jgi:hypothetical protein
MGDPLGRAGPVGGPFHRTVRVETVLRRVVTVAAHGEPGGAEGDAVVVDLERGAGGHWGVPPAGIEGDDGCEGFGLEELGDAIRVEATVVDDGAHRDGQRRGGAGLEDAVSTGRPHREVGAVGWGKINVDGPRMLGSPHAVLDVPRAEEVGVAVGIISPRGRGLAVPARMVTAEEAVGPAVTGGVPVGASARGERGAIATEPQRLPVTHEAPLDRGEPPTGKEEVFQPGEQRLGPGLVCSSEQLLGQARGDRIGRPGIPSLRGVPGRLFLLQVAWVAALAETARAQAVGAGGSLRPLFQPVHKGVEGADSGCLEGDEAGNRCAAWVGAQVGGPLRATLIVEQ